LLGFASLHILANYYQPLNGALCVQRFKFYLVVRFGVLLNSITLKLQCVFAKIGWVITLISIAYFTFFKGGKTIISVQPFVLLAQNSRLGFYLTAITTAVRRVI